MEEIDLKEIFLMFWKKKVEIILIIAIFAVIGYIYTTVFTTPMYTSSTTLVLAGTNDETAEGGQDSITTTDLTLNSKLVSTYSQLVKSNKVVRQVISNLGIDISEETLRNNISVSSVSDTELIRITVTTDNPQYSADIANETAKVFTDEVAEIYNINNVHVVDTAEESQTPSNINHKKDIIMFVAIGVVVAIAYVIIVNMLDTTVKTEEEIESLVKLPVLASIPMYDVAESKRNRRKRGGKRRR